MFFLFVRFFRKCVFLFDVLIPLFLEVCLFICIFYFLFLEVCFSFHVSIPLFLKVCLFICTYFVFCRFVFLCDVIFFVYLSVSFYLYHFFLQVKVFVALFRKCVILFACFAFFVYLSVPFYLYIFVCVSVFCFFLSCVFLFVCFYFLFL